MSVVIYCNPRRIEKVSTLADGSKEIVAGETFNDIPALIDGEGQFVTVVNAWFYHLRSAEGLEDLSSNAKGLLRYWRFLESDGMNCASQNQ